ncbi:MAG: hypothetical protein IPN70_00020 [Candidatus Moraniibacteriota bacterium]|nr:MAG: hypothetical protein IPN70_00020 [Candidatus Moranbacteria bacterium]
MQQKNIILSLIFVIIFLFGSILFLLFFKNTAPLQESPIYPPIDDLFPKDPPQVPPYKNSCQITNCHGSNIVCEKVEELLMCDMSFQIDDTCRQLVTCQESSSGCEVKKDPLFEECLDCVEKCKKQSDPEKSFNCASLCVDIKNTKSPQENNQSEAFPPTDETILPSMEGSGSSF